MQQNQPLKSDSWGTDSFPSLSALEALGPRPRSTAGLLRPSSAHLAEAFGDPGEHHIPTEPRPLRTLSPYCGSSRLVTTLSQTFVRPLALQELQKGSAEERNEIKQGSCL